MRIVTGGAGFIGSNIVSALNHDGITDILVVDSLSENYRNLCDCVITDYMDTSEFVGAIERWRSAGAPPIEAIYHQGACADTTLSDGRYMMENNFTFSKRLLRFALERSVPFVYASSAATYGNSQNFAPSSENERPLNVYALSKLVFDNHVRTLPPTVRSTVVGLRYFNVYGPRERHKGKMASMAFQIYQQIKATGVARLFKGTGGYGDGEQRRDFVSVSDVVKVNRFFANGPARRGIVNLGTGSSGSFNQLANAVIGALGAGRVEYIPFNESLKGKYQNFTEADIIGLRELGYDAPFASLEEGIREAVAAWERESTLS